MADRVGKTPPVKEGEIVFNFEILGQGNSGDPFGKIDGFIIFIKALEDHPLESGERVTIRVNKIMPSIGFAELHDGNEESQ